MGIATITEWDLDKNAAVSGGVALTVDFDPKSLQLTYTATGAAPATDKTAAGTWNKAAAQQTGQTVSLSVDLLFDTTSDGSSVQDKTDQLVSLTLPHNLSGTSASRRVVRLSWGSFLFYGNVDSMTQTIDFFTADGIPLRASIHVGLSQVSPPNPDGAAGAGGGGAGTAASLGGGVSFGANAGVGIGASVSAGVSARFSAGVAAGVSVGTTPFTFSQSGDSVQAIAARAGSGVSWQAVATANGIDNPRLIPPGTVLDASAQVSAQ